MAFDFFKYVGDIQVITLGMTRPREYASQPFFSNQLPDANSGSKMHALGVGVHIAVRFLVRSQI